MRRLLADLWATSRMYADLLWQAAVWDEIDDRLAERDRRERSS